MALRDFHPDMDAGLMVCRTGTWTHSWRVASALLWNDIKQGLRKHLVASGVKAWLLKLAGALFGLTFLAILHLAAFALLAYALAGNEANPQGDQVGLIRGLSASVWCFLLFVMLSGGLVRAIVVLHEQDDSNLLLSSPVSPRAVLAARLLGNAFQSCLVDGFIIVPWINLCIWSFGWRHLLGYLVWFALAVIVTCVDGLFSFGMIGWLGMRRARLFSQAIPFILIFGVTFFAGSVSVSLAQITGGASHARMSREMQDHFIAISHTPLVGVARAAAGNLFFLMAIVATAAALGLITLRFTERVFVEGTQNLAENVGAASRPRRAGPFRSNPLLLEIRKSLRLVVRTPMMLVQCIAQILTPVGISFVLGRDDPARAIAFFVLFATGVLSGMFTIAAGTVEECDDLLIMSPRGILLFRVGKMLSGCLIPLVFVLLTGLGLFLTDNSLLACAVLFAGLPLGITSSLVGESFATPVLPGTRPKLLSNPIMMIPLLGMQIISGLVAGLAVFTSALTPTFLLLALLACYIIFVVSIGLAQLRKPLFAKQ